jgi:pimeloyl-ACP methyl ester carboxylesterase
VREERHQVATPGGRLALVLHLPEAAGRVPCVVACHGLRGSKDSDKYRRLGVELPAAGLALARFDFRGCGESSGDEEDTTIASRIEDVRAVLAHLRHHRRLSGRFGLLGSSLGGFVALHVAATHPDPLPVVTWNTPSNLEDLMDTPGASADGLGIAFFEEMTTHRYLRTPAGVPAHLVVQAEADDVVPVEHGAALHARAGEPCDLVIVARADHRFSDPAHCAEAVRVSVQWFRQHLGGPGPHTASGETAAATPSGQ